MVVPKFRAWDKVDRKMYDVTVIYPYKKTVVLQGSIFDEPFLRGFKDVVLMQSTGMFDKKGTEIFDGDVVKAGEAKDRTFNLKIVSRKFGFHCVHSNGVDYYLGENTEEDYSALFESLEFFEVIGNIYENPELLDEVE